MTVGLQVNLHGYHSSPTGFRMHLEPSAQKPRPLRYAGEPESSMSSLGSTSFRRESPPIVANGEDYMTVASLNADARFGRFRVFHDIAERFLHNSIEADPEFLRKQSVDVGDFGGKPNLGSLGNAANESLNRLSQPEAVELERPQIIGNRSRFLDCECGLGADLLHGARLLI